MGFAANATAGQAALQTAKQDKLVKQNDELLKHAQMQQSANEVLMKQNDEMIALLRIIARGVQK